MLFPELALALLLLSPAAAEELAGADDPALVAPPLASSEADVPASLHLADEAASSEEADPPPEPPPAPPRGRHGAIRLAAEHYRGEAEAPLIEWRGSVIFPFDESQPVVRCSPLRACDIELEPGEVIRDVALGDTERWVARPLMSGDVDQTVPHVLVKPTEHGLETNLVVGTTRRTYHLRLVSPTEAEIRAGEAEDHRHVSFYYPEEFVASWTTEQELRRRQAGRRETASLAELSGPSLTHLNFDYSLQPDRKVRWAPRTVFDDGEHVYIQLPSSVRSRDLPALFVEIEGGGMAVSNYRVQGLWYVVDGLFRRAELVVGVGKARQKVEIVNERLTAGGV